jgi:sigma-54 dependent transcriptional regulator, acetoin dehydrogenase operon transcriptional activator AcoR
MGTMRSIMYNREKAIEAWKAFVNSGIILEGFVRPEIERSWLRCQKAGVDPWSTDFDEPNIKLLEEKRNRFERSLVSNRPVMRFLMALLGCNVSLQDAEDFIFELMTPMVAYPRTFGTFMREEKVGTGNATIVAYEKKPVRCEGFEQYRAIAQSYCGVSAPFLDAGDNYFGALNLNAPFDVLPPSALDLCAAGVELSKVLYNAKSSASSLLSSVSFFRPLLMLYENPTLLIDAEGHILSANGAMLPYCPDWEDYSYGSQSLGAYLGKATSIRDILSLSGTFEVPVPVVFRKPRSRSEYTMRLLRRVAVDLDGQPPFYVCVFEEDEAPRETKSKPVASKRFVQCHVGENGVVDYIGESTAWRQVDRMVDKVATVNANVLLLGETGSGKEVVARALHRRSGRKGNFVAVNCGALPRDLLVAELFGYESGAFTGARESGATGKFEYADGGTLFLDEIGEMPVDMQVSLLRVLQEQSVTKLGSNESRALDVRVIAATNQDIEQLIEEKKFRSDLYYRLSLVEIHLPPLRARVDDIARLVDYFNGQLSHMLNIPRTPFPVETMEAFSHYTWPGNVRELSNVVERSLILCGEGALITVDSLPPYIANARNEMMKTGASFVSDELPSARSEVSAGEEEMRRDKARLIGLLEKHDGNITATAKEMGISRQALCRLIERLHLRVRVVVEEDCPEAEFEPARR